MNDYIIKIVHPEYGPQGDIPGQGSNAFEALEKAVGHGHNGTFQCVNIAYVRNIQTGFTVAIEFCNE